MDFDIQGEGGAGIPAHQKWRMAMLCKEIAQGVKDLATGKEAKQRFALMTCTDKATGQPVEAVVLVREVGERLDFLPVAIMPRGDLCELLVPPADTVVQKAGEGVKFGEPTQGSGNVIPFPLKKPGPFDIN